MSLPSPMSDAMSTLDAPPCTNQGVQLLGNPNFELGPGNGWVEIANEPIVRDAGNLPRTPQSGNYAAWLGGLFNDTMTIYQDVAIPAGASDVQVTFYRYIETTEGNGIWDTFDVSLRSTANSVLETIVDWDNTHTNNAWQRYTHDVAGDFADQTIRLHLTSTHDDSNVTNFFVDTLTVTATVCL